jgi:SAM-dependent methyltransferase
LVSSGLDEQRQHEWRKYRQLARVRPLYGSGNHGAEATRWVKGLHVLDVGCGNNAFIRGVRELGTGGVGVDVANPGADVMAAAHALPFPDHTFDVVTSFDMLEHLVPGEVDEVLAEFARVSWRYIFTICHRDSRGRCNGETLHPTVQPRRWWMERIGRLGTCKEHDRFVMGEWYR